ncbi:CapA family protein [Bacillus sp. 165]|uniref:CapA family protein n=1 Tax=Bacillus sp. 165 TaxID=1529117 RepID=UPI001ADA6BC4|nr:CapA family protein [Bacillus sp. 165]MBO9129229.1 CapA family protein [Bacillus sp. 165]
MNWKAITLCVIMMILTACNTMKDTKPNEEESKNEASAQSKTNPKAQLPKPAPKPVEKTTIQISAAGDFTIGTDESFGYTGTFNYEAEKNGLEYFTKNIQNLFKNDDFTTVNLETTLTTATKKASKTFRFKGDPSYAEIFPLSGIEAVNLANNHSHDYLQQGFTDTISNLEKYKVGYFGYEHKYITTVKGIKVGALGYEGWQDTTELRNQVSQDIASLRDQGAKIILVHYHWGQERMYVPNESQKSLAHFTIDSGADLVLGHHPHVIQGIEEYNGKFIVYSLGNFMFGGNKNPSDKDTLVFQQTFYLENGELTAQKEIQVIPFRISSVTNQNNYQPTPLEGAEAERVKNKILNLSAKIREANWTVYQPKVQNN